MSMPTWRTAVAAVAVATTTATVAAVPASAIAQHAVAQHAGAQSPDGHVDTLTGTLAGGAAYRVRMPDNWNGTLAVYAHGLVFPGDDNPAEDAPAGPVGEELLDRGVALAGTDFGGTGWAVEEALRAQRDVVDVVTEEFRRPTHTIAWGESLGGMVSTALAERYPARFDGAVSLCGVQAGAGAGWDHFLDSAFVFKHLLGMSAPFTVTGIHDPGANLESAGEVFRAAQASPSGRARLALMAAVAQVPGAIDPSGPVSAPTLEQRFEARTRWLEAPYLVLAFAERGELESRAGGNPSSNIGVDYRTLLVRSRQTGDVAAMYGAAGLSLEADLDALADAPRIRAHHRAEKYLAANLDLTGKLSRPVLTLRNVADGALPSSHDRAYARAVARAGRSTYLRQAFAGRPGHCTFTPAETLVAFRRLERRVATGSWGDTSATALNKAALALGPELNQGGGFPVPPAFVHHHPLRFPRHH